jgi:hypothetical protein
MLGRRFETARGVATAFLLLAVSSSVIGLPGCRYSDARARFQTTLTDKEFWDVSTRLSEPTGAFAHSDNLVSNETQFVQTIRMLQPTGGAYIGVGPEQNFSYIARLRPATAFIVDIRRENRNLHLMYKALFELSDDRADFLSRLFSRERAPGLGPKTTVSELFEKYGSAQRRESLRETNARLIRERLLVIHGFPLSPDDLEWIEFAFNAFYTHGPGINYGRLGPRGSPSPSYRFLMTATDIGGRNRSYLATEEGFAFLKQLHQRNLIVPVVGDFAGPSSIRLVGDYIRQHGNSVRAFYGSNVEVYLNRQQSALFCGNLAALPYDSRTWFIGSQGMRRLSAKLEVCPPRTR